MEENKEPFWVHCGKCSHQWAPCFLPISAAEFGRLTHNQCPACGSRKVLVGEFPKPTDEGDPIAWLSNGDTGISSRTIWRVMMRRAHGRNDYAGVPRDPSDFGRCYRLLQVMPSWRSRLPEVAAEFPEWAGLVGAWDELTALYERELPTGTAPLLYDRIQQLTASPVSPTR